MIQSFLHAIAGVFAAIKSEKHIRFHLFALLFVTGLGVYFQITNLEWIVIVFACSLVISMELMNTALEKLADFCSLEYQELIKKSKDIAAGAVLITTIGAVIVGALIFYPYLFK